jgi:hypothetical protein
VSVTGVLRPVGSGLGLGCPNCGSSVKPERVDLLPDFFFAAFLGGIESILRRGQGYYSMRFNFAVASPECQ